MKKYTPLHIHSHFSIGDSILSVEEYIDWAKENGINSIALTDHGNMCGCFGLNQDCLKTDIKPILGVEAYCIFEDEFEKIKEKDSGITRDHLVLLAKNKQGYFDLLELVGKSMRENFYYRPIIFYDDMFKKSENIICTTACLAGRVSKMIINKQFVLLDEFLNKMKSELKENFYLEVMDNELGEQRVVNEWIFNNYKKYDITPVFTTDTHYCKKEHNTVHDVHCLNIRKQTFETGGDKLYNCRMLYLKTYDEIVKEAEIRGHIDVEFVKLCLDNTNLISEKVEKYDLKSQEVIMPRFGDNAYEMLKEKAFKGLKAVGKDQDQIYIDRLNQELEVIEYKNFSDYFLIICEIVDFANDNNIFIGVGRGSAAGSLLSYVLNITKLDPIEYGLFFERFLSKVRKDPPDIDIDFDSKNRYMIEDYLKQKYGIDSVSHIISFGRYGIKGSIRDTFRAYYGTLFNTQLDSMMKMIDDSETDFDKAIKEAISVETNAYKLKEFYKDNKPKFEIAKILLNKNRHLTLHASGTVITPDRLEKFIPIIRIKNEIAAGLQEGADIRNITDAGLMKFDLLGLNACCIIKDALKLIKVNHDVKISDIIQDKDNPKVLKEFADGNTFGIFQFEGKNITNFTKKVHPEKFTDLIAINALYRPAVIQANGLNIFLENRKTFVEDKSKPFEYNLRDTFGVLIYQEQVLQLFNKLAGFTIEEADEARHALKLLFKGRDDYSEFNEIMERFKQGCLKLTNYNTKEIADIMETIKQFSSYSFNKSHAASYSMNGYIMMYFKVFYPKEFYAALLTNTDNVEKVQDKQKQNMLDKYMLEIYRSSGVKLVSPDVNISEGSEFTICDEGIVYPIDKIKNVGTKAAQSIIENRPYESFQDFLGKVNLRVVNKRVIKSLIYADAIKFPDVISEYNKKYKEDLSKNEVVGVFSNIEETIQSEKIFAKDIEEFDQYKHNLSSGYLDKCKTLSEMQNSEGDFFLVNVFVKDIVQSVTKSGKYYDKVIVTDFNENVLIYKWPWEYKGKPDTLKKNKTCFLQIKKNQQGFISLINSNELSTIIDKIRR